MQGTGQLMSNERHAPDQPRLMADSIAGLLRVGNRFL
jgi:hypothetical protein